METLQGCLEEHKVQIRLITYLLLAAGKFTLLTSVKV